MNATLFTPKYMKLVYEYELILKSDKLFLLDGLKCFSLSFTLSGIQEAINVICNDHSICSVSISLNARNSYTVLCTC